MCRLKKYLKNNIIVKPIHFHCDCSTQNCNFNIFLFVYTSITIFDNSEVNTLKISNI